MGKGLEKVNESRIEDESKKTVRGGKIFGAKT